MTDLLKNEDIWGAATGGEPAAGGKVEAAANAASAVGDAFNVLGTGGTVLNVLAPPLLEPGNVQKPRFAPEILSWPRSGASRFLGSKFRKSERACQCWRTQY